MHKSMAHFKFLYEISGKKFPSWCKGQVVVLYVSIARNEHRNHRQMSNHNIQQSSASHCKIWVKLLNKHSLLVLIMCPPV